jgi:competence protein ComEC
MPCVRQSALRIAEVIDGPLGSFADALITGERARIPRAMNDSLQASGLFHILSISGLHMAMVAGSAFWLVRALLALSSTTWHCVTRSKNGRRARRWLIGGFYMLLADGGAATERSFIMIAVMFFAVMVDRPAISLHNLAVAAVLILLLSPEQAVAASFQMSFLAVMGLAAFFEWWNARVPQEFAPARGLLWRMGRKVVLVAAASLATSFIAGTLSSIPAAHHFGRVAPYSVISNALALPVVSIARDAHGAAGRTAYAVRT